MQLTQPTFLQQTSCPTNMPLLIRYLDNNLYFHDKIQSSLQARLLGVWTGDLTFRHRASSI